jgi:hypothetical protein
MPIDMELLSMDDGWAVTLGDGRVAGEIMRLSTGRWTVAAEFDDRTLLDIDVVSEAEVWIAGNSFEQGLQGMLLHGRDGVFQDVPAPECRTLIGLQMLDADHGWAVGQDSTLDTCILRFDDDNWTREDSPGQSLLVALDLDQTGTGWAIGADGLVLRREQGVWSEVPNPAADRDDVLYLELRRVGPNEAWAVGSDTRLSLHYTDGSWRPEDLGVPGTLTSLDVTPSGQVWAAGRKPAPNDTPIEQREPLMLIHEDGSWREIELPEHSPVFGAIDLLDATSGWALGFGGALRVGAPHPNRLDKSYLPLLFARR